MATHLVANRVGLGLSYYLEKIYGISTVLVSETIDEFLWSVEKNNLSTNLVLVIDNNFSDNFARFKSSLVEIYHKGYLLNFKVVVISKNDKLEGFLKKYSSIITLKYLLTDKIEIEEIAEIIKLNDINHHEQSKKSLFNSLGVYKSKSIKDYESEISMGFSNRNMSLMFSGIKGSGTSSIVSSIGKALSEMKIKTLIIDLDLDDRGMNVFFKDFGEKAQVDKFISRSLINCINAPDRYKSNTYEENDYLNISTLSYSEKSLEPQTKREIFEKFIASIQVLKRFFNIILIDLPLESISLFYQGIKFIDKKIINLNNNLGNIALSTKYINDLDIKDKNYLIETSSMVLNKYNDLNRYENAKFSPTTTINIISSLLDIYIENMKIIGVFELSKENSCMFETSFYSQLMTPFKNDLLRILRNIL